MSNNEKAINFSNGKKPFDATCKGPKIGVSFDFVPVPEIKAEVMNDRLEDGIMTIQTLSTRKLETLNDKDQEKSTNDIDVKTILKKKTLKNGFLPPDGSSDSLSDSRKKYAVSILRKSRYGNSESPNGRFERKSTITEQKAEKNNKGITFNEDIQIKLVESWKAYNLESHQPTTACHCNTF